MDNEVPAGESDERPTSPSPGARSLPRSAIFGTSDDRPRGTPAVVPESGTIASAEARDQAGVFGHLVQDDGDIAGLVAYSIYKQNKLDWLRAFEAQKGRAPEAGELAAYIIGEGTPRRLATYRHLAEATLAGHGPEVGGTPAIGGRPQISRSRAIFPDRRSYATGLVAVYALIAVLFIFGFWLAMHFTMTTR